MDVLDVIIKATQALILPAIAGIIKIIADQTKMKIRIEDIARKQDLELRGAEKMRSNIYDTVERIEIQNKDVLARIARLEERVHVLEKKDK